MCHAPMARHLPQKHLISPQKKLRLNQRLEAIQRAQATRRMLASLDADAHKAVDHADEVENHPHLTHPRKPASSLSLGDVQGPL